MNSVRRALLCRDMSAIARHGASLLLGALLAAGARWAWDEWRVEQEPARAAVPLVAPAVEQVKRFPATEPDLSPRVRELEREKTELGGRLAETEARLAKSEAELGTVAERLAELRRPMEMDIYSSTLRAELKSGEVIVTGGYAQPDGRRVYAFTQPVVETMDNGAPGVRIGGQLLAVGDEAGKRAGLETLTTTAANTIQHGEVWVADEHTSVLAGLAAQDGVEMVSLPNMSIASGATAVVSVGDKLLRISPVVGADQSLDVEVRMEQTPLPAAPAETSEPPVIPIR